jgi:hypothetical protein
MNSISKVIISCMLTLITSSIYAQEVVSSIRGKVLDADSDVPVPFASVALAGTNPPIGAYADESGDFEISNLPVGRYDLIVTIPGYEPASLNGILVTSAKAVYVQLKIKESFSSMETIVVRAENEKENPINNMATVSARQLTVEEANKYAGGFDDPARMASSFAGVASDLATNGIVIRGNAPKGLLWRMEGVEVPNPNHFGEIAGFGAGGITALSSQMLANSDFFTGAFPAEYGNALSGVFDLSMRRGNLSEYEHSVSIGALGIDVSSEGPINKKAKSSYLFNYRYSSLALVDHIIPGDLGIKYQDLSYKFHFPSKKAGVFTFWGLGFLDNQTNTPVTDSTERKFSYQAGSGKNNITTGVAGFSNQLFLGGVTYIKTTVSASANKLQANWQSPIAPNYNTRYEISDIFTGFYNFTATTFLNHKFGARHTNRTGVVIQNMHYNLNLREAIEIGDPLTQYVDQKGNSNLFQAYSQSTYRLGEKLLINPGLNFQYFQLSSKASVEPRLGVRWQFTNKQSLSFGYGKHSRIEKLNFYMSKVYDGNTVTQPNKSLDFSKAHHFVLGYDRMFGKNVRLKIEPYYQYLYDVPVIQDSSFSFINLQYNWVINSPLVNTGKGRNIGIDITFERFLNQGWFYLITASIFDSRYKGGDGVWRNTLFNKQFISNILVGKEWSIGKDKHNQISASGKLTYMKGNRWTPVLTDESLHAQEIIVDHSRTFEAQGPDTYFLHATITYRKNKKKHSSLWSLQVLNALASKSFQGYEYNILTKTIDRDYETVIIPNLSYKIQF